MKTREEILERFKTERTVIISEMLDNPDEVGIYPTTICFNKLDELANSILDEYVKEFQLIEEQAENDIVKQKNMQ